MKSLVFIIITGFCCSSISAQDIAPTKRDVLEKFGFEEHSITIEGDTTFFYYHKKPDKTPEKLVLYLQGTSPDPLFSIEKEKNKFTIYRWFPADYKLLDENYAYAVIAKAGVNAIQRTEQSNYEKYHNLNSLEYRVKQADTVINFIKKNLIKDVDQIIVYGHSEGAPVAAKLATINRHITHLGFWAGNALPDFYDFALFNSKAVAKGKMSTEDAKKNVMELFDSFNEIAQNKDATEASSKDDYTNKRWWSYAEPPLNNLIKIDIPIYVQVAGNDQSAPIESTYIIPLEFMRLGKTNLTYEICAGCDHGFTTKNKDMWEDIFLKFMTWTQE